MKLANVDVYTAGYDKAVDMAMYMVEQYEHDYTKVELSDFTPIIIHGVLNYTFTIKMYN